MIARIKTICAFGAISACAFANAYSAPGERGKICVPVYKADSAGEPETFRYTAQVMPIETVNITSRISTDLVKVGFKDGEYVEREGSYTRLTTPVMPLCTRATSQK